MQTPAQRKAAERARRRAAGQVLVQEWIHKDLVVKLKEYIAKLRRTK